MMLGMPLLLVFILYTQLLRGVGDTVTPLLALCLSTAVGLLLTPALIRGWLGLPRLGVVSAAVAGWVSFALALAFCGSICAASATAGAGRRTARAAHRCAPAARGAAHRRAHGRADGDHRAGRAGHPEPGQRLRGRRHGGYGAVNQIVNYVQFPALSIAITASILGAQAIGAGRVERLSAIVRTGLLLNGLLTGALVLAGYALSRWLLGFSSPRRRCWRWRRACCR
jgi:Na+-driven multidrug efflux pump